MPLHIQQKQVQLWYTTLRRIVRNVRHLEMIECPKIEAPCWGGGGVSKIKSRCQFDLEVSQSLSRFELPLKQSTGSKCFLCNSFRSQVRQLLLPRVVPRKEFRDTSDSNATTINDKNDAQQFFETREALTLLAESDESNWSLVWEAFHLRIES